MSLNIEECRDLSNLNGIVFSFMSERGRQNISYKEYLDDTELREMVNDMDRYRLILGRTIFTYSPKYLNQKPKTAQMLRDLEEEQRVNPLRFFAPSGKQALDYLNDYESTLCILTACNRFGKALDDDTLIPSPSGEKRIADLKEGDIVFGGDGKKCKVTGVFPQGEKECFEISFDNGEVSLTASGDHLWKYLKHNRAFKSRSRTAYNEWEVLTTNEIIELQGESADSQKRGYIPLAGCPPLGKTESLEKLPIPPYSLGALIGDGALSSGDIRLSSADKELIDRVALETNSVMSRYSEYDYGFTKSDIKNRLIDIGLQGTRSDDKFIPEEYLLSSAYNRIELLRGLMDTDGCKSFKAGEYCTVSKRLAYDVERLVRSLGGSAKTSISKNKTYIYNGERRPAKDAYRVRILLWDFNPFWIKRKADEWEYPTRRRGRLVYDIKPVESRMCTCISVDSDDHTFLAGDYIVTHNTQTMLIKKLINNIPCDPNWEIFTKYGVKYRPWRGGKNVGLASYELDFHNETLLPMLLDWLPKSELGVYAKDYKGKGAKKVTMRVEPVLPLACGTKFMFSAMSQSQGKFEGNVKHDWGWDEQGSEAAFDGADERTRTFVGGRHDFAMTPHKVEGRPDTGAGSWINKIYSGEKSKGHKVKTYMGQVWDVPDWIYPESQKIQAFYKWVIEPEKTKNDKDRREGNARFFGKWHESSGLVVDEWDSSVHVIEPFDIPDHWTLYRALDHGDKHPAACLWGAVSPAGDLFLFRDYLKTGRVPSQISREIIEESGNRRTKIGSYNDPKTELNYDRYEEVMCNESYQFTVFDARAFSQKHNGVLLSKLYTMAGLKVKQGSGHDSDHYVPIIKEWFVLDHDKKHFVTGELGAPRIYVFNTCQDFIKTIKRWVWVERKTKSTERLAKESPTKTEDDLCDCMKLMIQAGPKFKGNARMSDRDYYGNLNLDAEVTNMSYSPTDKLTGY